MSNKNPWDDFSKSSDERSNDKNTTTSNKDKITSKFEKINKTFFTNKNSGSGLDFLSFDSFDKIIKNIFLVIIGIICIWLMSGFYVVQQEEKALILRFGKFARENGPGLHYHIPYPIESIVKEVVTRIRVIKIGDDYSYKKRQDVQSDNFILTGDENMVDMVFEVHWRIADLKAFVFNIRDGQTTIQQAAKSTIREVVSREKLSDILTSNRSKIEKDAKLLLQEIMSSYNSGVEIELVQILKLDPPRQVIDAFRDVQTARVDKESEINKAYIYENDVLPNARGEAGKIIEDADSYYISITNEAKGESERFNKIYEQYKNAPYVTRKRIYLETMAKVFKDNNTTLVDDNVKNIILNMSSDNKNVMGKNSNNGNSNKDDVVVNTLNSGALNTIISAN
jgi:membrane protease subunit HflK